ncbi:hypothetical protein SU69_01220 [Thermosipho melanesiensis]|uniref:YlxP-like protein n=2 Tax=Thermosipho melanesiensis TaxID=46541 RepID=A6LJK2_THEM4|nr:DUF503 domain-containing protein [Thermosipho melanesiensis]ABR30103.1 protein of unknown function DUF503 [Thermosipho melanesiensis BI429]APT73300.1 hypothetical protein BW47_01260 [Thermosipho melanesiensis]OOC38691.1 hypothetical protein SU68_01220 [Thermosipho melanesiensis]OOC40495.1 hypothetical protein SU70_01220 [Thermosipho melanesiensis]OOC40760.1 hypothetical protein SU69_01220 [Thermosipho melanesiensis]
MPVSFLEVDIRLFGVFSLKEKRSIVKRLLNDIRKKYNVSIIEYENQNSKELMTIGISFVSLNKSSAFRTQESIIEYLERNFSVENVYKEVYD